MLVGSGDRARGYVRQVSDDLLGGNLDLEEVQSDVSVVILFTGPALTADDASEFKLDPNTFRLMNDTGYEFWISAVVAGALVVWATSAVALRTGLLPRWFGWLGILVGIIQLFAILFFPVFVYWGWIVIAGALLAWRPAASHAAPEPPAT